MQKSENLIITHEIIGSGSPSEVTVAIQDLINQGFVFVQDVPIQMKRRIVVVR